MRYSTSNLHREIFPVNERANYTSMSEKSLPPHGDYEMSLQPRSHNEYQPQNPQKANSPYHLSNGAASLLRLVTIADSTEIGRAHVCTPVTNANLVCRLMLDKKKKKQ